MDIKGYVITIIVAVITCIATLIAKDVYESVKNKTLRKKVEEVEKKVDKYQADMNLLKESQKNQLWLSLTRTCSDLIAKGKASDLEKAAIAASYKSYEGLGGNHGMQVQVEKVMLLPAK